MKRIIKMMILLIVLVLSFSLIGCNSATESSKEKQETKEVKTTETVKIKPEKASNKNKAESTQITPQKKSNPVSPKTHTATKKQSNTNVVVQKPTSTSSSQTKAVSQKTATSSTPKTTAQKIGSQVPLKTVTLTITGPKEHRTILSSIKVKIKDSQTILDALLNGANNAGITVDHTGSGATAYVQGISNDKEKYSFYEFDYGPKSGWLFKLNGVSLTKSSGLVKIKAGDRIECYYTQ